MRTATLKRLILFVVLLFLPFAANSRSSYAQASQITFPETGKTLSGGFLAYWQQNGGLAQFGFPISIIRRWRSGKPPAMKKSGSIASSHRKSITAWFRSRKTPMDRLRSTATARQWNSPLK